MRGQKMYPSGKQNALISPSGPCIAFPRQKSSGIIIRRYARRDFDDILALFHATVHSINRRDYSTAELNAWAPTFPDRTKWTYILEAQETFIAEREGLAVGFANWDGITHFDCLYVHKDFQRKGIATLLAEAIEQSAQRKKTAALSVEASITAKPFFEKRGYLLKRQQTVERAGCLLINFIMEKLLASKKHDAPHSSAF